MSSPRLLAVAIALCTFCFRLTAQDLPYGQLPPAQVGVPYDYVAFPELDQALGELTAEAGVTITSSVSGNVPPGLSVSGGTRVSGTPTRAGSYAFTVQLNIAINIEGFNQTFPIPFPLSLEVRDSAGGISVEGGAISFSYTQGSALTGPLSRTIRISNRGSQARSVSVSANSAGWLSASGGATVPPYSSATVTVTANPSALSPNVYSGSVEITASGGANEQFRIPVVLGVASSGPAIATSQAGVTFEVQQGSPVTLSQTFQVTGANAANIQFDTVASALGGGGGWLRVSPASGSVTPTTPATVTVTVASQALATGTYYGQIEIRSNAAANSPRTVNVVLSVAPATTSLAPRVSTTAVVLVQRPNTPVASQTVAVTNVAATTLPLSTSLTFDGPNAGWFTAKPAASSVAPGQTVNIEVARNPAVRLAANVYRTEMTVSLGQTQRRVAVVLIIPPVPGNTAAVQSFATQPAPPQLEGCTPTKLVPVFASLGSGFSVVAAWPSALELRVIDDCSDPMVRGTATVSFSNGDPPLVMSPLGEGRWSATWQPRAGVQNLVLTADARTVEGPQLQGTAQIGGAAANNDVTPVISAGGVVGAAAPIPGAPLAPGSYISVFGKSMASGLTVAPSLPFPTDLSGTQVILGGKRLPMQFAADGQINALVPFDVALNVPQLLVVRRGNALSMPEQVFVSQTQPAVFTKNSAGTGEGIVVGARADGTQFLIAPNSPVAAGEALIIYCTGLGPTNPAVPAGAAAPSDPLATTVAPVTVTVGGKAAAVFFAGMAPGFAGLYQVNAIVPEGITPGAAVELVLTAGGRSSSPVTVAVK